jgi:L,D-transpeptidase catalytic domain/PKD domain/Putative peptidoglycan binding domain
VRRFVILVAALAFVPAAHAAPPAVSIQASASSGPAPLTVTLTASGDLATYHWDLGDGTTADGAMVQHVYGPGRFTARVTATAPNGETAQAQVAVTSLGLTLKAPRVGRYRQLLEFHGRLVPSLKGVRVGLYRGDHRIAGAKTRRGGTFSLRGRVGGAGSSYTVRYQGAVSNPVTPAVRPRLDTGFLGSGQIGHPLTLTVRERPAAAGTLTVKVWRAGRLFATRSGAGRLRIRLATGRATTYRVSVRLAPAQGYARTSRSLHQTVFLPDLRVGSHGPSVLGLEQRLHELHYALESVDGYFGIDTADAVVAFQKLHGLPRTGATDLRFWRALDVAAIPTPRHRDRPLHVEVSKQLQVLFIVRDGQVALIVPVSTGATGNTPLGVWHVYSRVAGYNAEQMYYSSFFTGAFAIHGYHSVPAYPASHGCVRIPIWVAKRVYSLIHYGTTVYIY